MTAGVYLHIPFCKSRCSYCDFATDIYRDSAAVESYVDAVCAEIDSFATSQPAIQIDTIYFGGGTPSLLSPFQVSRLMTSVREKFGITDEPEITMEMNPATVTPESLAGFRDLGVNRASFGVQTFNDRALKLLARGHDAQDARNTFRMLREAGYDNVSLDLIAGLPGQTLSDWESNLDEALAMHPEHLSLYLLEVHEATPLAEQILSRRQPVPDEDLAAEMYEMMLDTTVAAGYEQYEISNFSKPGFASRHNTKYWRLEPVYAFGVSAHSFDGRERYANERDTAKYVEMIETQGTAEVMREEIDTASEFAFLGLRLNGGVDLDEFQRRHGNGADEKVTPLLKAKLLEVSDGRLRLTRKGMLFSNEVFEKFV
ncbi:MAG: radical SAM family heme chaperone HemW [Blastocatellia bacterium]|nr:radical SAM family heme chaperone HemW [Blastocatellia bacterium]